MPPVRKTVRDDIRVSPYATSPTPRNHSNPPRQDRFAHRISRDSSSTTAETHRQNVPNENETTPLRTPEFPPRQPASNTRSTSSSGENLSISRQSLIEAYDYMPRMETICIVLRDLFDDSKMLEPHMDFIYHHPPCWAIIECLTTAAKKEIQHRQEKIYELETAKRGLDEMLSDERRISGIRNAYSELGDFIRIALDPYEDLLLEEKGKRRWEWSEWILWWKRNLPFSDHTTPPAKKLLDAIDTVHRKETGWEQNGPRHLRLFDFLAGCVVFYSQRCAAFHSVRSPRVMSHEQFRSYLTKSKTKMNNGDFRFEYDFVENSVSTYIGNALRQYSTEADGSIIHRRSGYNFWATST